MDSTTLSHELMVMTSIVVCFDFTTHHRADGGGEEEGSNFDVHLSGLMVFAIFRLTLSTEYWILPLLIEGALALAILSPALTRPLAVR